MGKIIQDIKNLDSFTLEEENRLLAIIDKKPSEKWNHQDWLYIGRIGALRDIKEKLYYILKDLEEIPKIKTSSCPSCENISDSKCEC